MTIDLKNAKNERIYVSERIPHPAVWYTDTIQLKDGKAVFRGKVTDPHFVVFVVTKENGDMQGSFGMFLDNSRVQVKGDFNDLKQVVVTGSKTNDEYLEIEKNGAEVFRNFSRIRYERSKAFKDDRARYDSLTPLIRRLTTSCSIISFLYPVMRPVGWLPIIYGSILLRIWIKLARH